MKKILALVLAVFMIATLAACSSSEPAETSSAAPASEPAAPADDASAPADDASAPADATATGVKINNPDDILIGSCIYKFDDTFMTNVRNAMNATATELGIPEIEIVDSQNNRLLRTTRSIPTSPKALPLWRSTRLT